MYIFEDLPIKVKCLSNTFILLTLLKLGGHGGRVVALSPPTSEIGVRFLARPEVGKLVVAYRWLPVYSTEP